MRQRCYNPRNKRFHYYGGRGIRVCKAWHDFKTFLEWCESTYEEGKSIDRINNDGNYEPSNCRWATNSEQQKNSRHDTPKRRLQTIKRVAGHIRRMREIYGDPDTRTRKHCPSCQTFLKCNKFKKNPSSRDGLDSMCHPCRKAYDRRYAAYKRKRSR